MAKSSYRSLLQSSYLIGGAQVIFILTGLIKMKVAAVLLGPGGVGLVGLYTNLMQASSTVASLGLGHASTRQIASALGQNRLAAIDISRKAIYVASGLLAVVGGGLFWLSRQHIAQLVIGSEQYSEQVGWLSVGVALSVATTGPNAILTGTRRVRDLARISVGTGLLATIISVIALWVWGEQAILLMVVAIPALAFVFGHIYAARVKSSGDQAKIGLNQIADEWSVLRRVGLPFMAAGLATLLGPLIVRTLVQRELGLDASGQFQAAWSIGLTYMGLVLGVMTSDFHPRLAGVIMDKRAATQLVNEQIDVAVSLCAPILLLILGLAPWVMLLLYSTEFMPAVDVLRWQLLGDVLKVISFPLGFVLLASGASGRFLLAEALGMSVFVVSVWQTLPLWGVQATGVAFLLMYFVYLPVVWYWAKQLIDYQVSRILMMRVLLLFVSAVIVSLLSHYSQLWAASVAVVLAAGFAVGALVRIRGHLGRDRETET